MYICSAGGSWRRRVRVDGGDARLALGSAGSHLLSVEGEVMMMVMMVVVMVMMMMVFMVIVLAALIVMVVMMVCLQLYVQPDLIYLSYYR